MTAVSALTGDAPVVVLAPHPDDESLGCGGLLNHAFGGAGAHVICMTDGSGSHPGSQDWPGPRLARTRRHELTAAVRHLGGTARDITWLGHRDGRLGAQDADAVASGIARLCADLGARHLFAPAIEDYHADHKDTARIAALVAAQTPGLSLFSYPVWCRWDDPDFAGWSTGRDPLILSTESCRAVKHAAVHAHRTQLGQRIGDDPDGFVMSAAFVDTFVTQDEIYWRTHA